MGECYAGTPYECAPLSHGEPSVRLTCSAFHDRDMNSNVPYSRFVFDNYTWNPDGPDYSDYNGKLIPSRIPLSAIMSGKISALVYASNLSYGMIQDLSLVLHGRTGTQHRVLSLANTLNKYAQSPYLYIPPKSTRI